MCSAGLLLIGTQGAAILDLSGVELARLQGAAQGQQQAEAMQVSQHDAAAGADANDAMQVSQASQQQTQQQAEQPVTEVQQQLEQAEQQGEPDQDLVQVQGGEPGAPAAGAGNMGAPPPAALPAMVPVTGAVPTAAPAAPAPAALPAIPPGPSRECGYSVCILDGAKVLRPDAAMELSIWEHTWQVRAALQCMAHGGSGLRCMLCSIIPGA